MKRTILFVITVCLCYGSFANGYSQTRGKQSKPQQDSLFVNDTFQPSVFDAAFPTAQKLLSAR